ncbi:MAG: hypothetical protein V4567_12220 [Pseudomonadota bacterium]
MKMDYLAVGPDDGTRAREGVVVSLHNTASGRSRLIFDDVFAEGGDPRAWKHRALYTYAELDDARLNEMSLPDEDYRRIGEALVARLLALNGRVK